MSNRNSIWPSVEQRLAQGETGFTDERQEIDFTDAPIAEFTARFARWVGFKGMDHGGRDQPKYAMRRELGLKFNRNRPIVKDLL